ncbi:MAG TPA: ATP-binding protein [Candidatus Bathyarchaeia archaeon]|nr:ATP-binding protein [Candidatus Bathyarchaeia archaeon]
MAAPVIELHGLGETEPARHRVTALLPALTRLDKLLDLAVKSTQAPSQRSVSFRGLFIDREQVNRLLSQMPGEAQFPLVYQSLEATARPPADESPLEWIARSFGLGSFEADVILLALAPEIDLRYEKIFAYLQDDVTRKRPTVELALNLLCSSLEEKLDRRACFSSHGQLIRQRLVQIAADPNQSDPSSLAHYIKLDDQIKRLLLGQAGLDDRLSGFCELIEPSMKWDDLALNEETKRGMLRLAGDARSSNKPLRLYFQRRGGPEKREAAEALANSLSSRLLVARIDRFPDHANATLLWNLVMREAQLQNAILFITSLDEFRTADAPLRCRDLLESATAFNGITLFAGKHAWEPQSIPGLIVTPIDFQVSHFEERQARWQKELSAAGADLDREDLAMLAGRFRLTPFQITQAVATACSSSAWRRAHSGYPAAGATTAPSLDELAAAARAQCGHELAALAHKIEPRYGWDDLILAPDPKAQLREICAQCECRDIVYEQWGFDRKLSLGKGLNVLFAGGPGTGKTMGAEVIARELRLDLYRIDLSQVVSKYIGETEKNLDRIFTAAEDSNAILFFDEADALFGKRSEVRDAHDRYANIEISYLLQKMEEYQGASILATNLRQNLDDAFVRRLQAIVEFPFPDEGCRRRIWESVFPKEAPVGADVRFDLLAREVRLAGGNIKNMALAAAFFAAGDGGVVRTTHLVQAARREHQKLARSWNPGELSRIVAESALELERNVHSL